MLSRRNFLITSVASAAGLQAHRLFNFAPAEVLASKAAWMPPDPLAQAFDQFYGFLKLVSSAQGITAQQRLVLNSTIVPFDIAPDTPFYNQELFRQYADKTFTGGVERLTAGSAAGTTERFSSQYRSLINIITSRIDQNHPGINNQVADIKTQLKTATTALTTKVNELQAEWDRIAQARNLKQGSVDYDTQYVAWAGQVQWANQVQTYTDEVERLTSNLDALRRQSYTPAEVAALDSYAYLTPTYNIARPWTAEIERAYSKQNAPLTDLMLADPKKWSPALFDSSPSLFPLGDLNAFLTAGGVRGFDATSSQFSLTGQDRSWTASGGASFLGFSVGGGASGASSFTSSVSNINSLSISFANIAEVFADRGAWFNPAVLLAPAILHQIEDRREVAHLGYVCVSLILARGTKLTLQFSQAVANTDWSQQSFQANAGVSFLGFSFGGQGRSSNSTYNLAVSTDGKTVTIADDPAVTRVLGVRVEPFMSPAPAVRSLAFELKTLTAASPALKANLDALQNGRISYADFQKARVAAEKQARGGHP